MILAVDVGNTNIVFGGISEGKTSFISRIGTDKNKTADEYAVLFIKVLYASLYSFLIFSTEI